MSMLELRHVSKSYGEGANEVDALSDIDLTVERGSLVAIMGPSGSGKSTLLTIAGSLEEPTTGEVMIDGVRLSGMSRNDKARLRRRSVGYVFQDFNLLAGLTAVENVSLPLELDGVSMKKATRPRHGRPRGPRSRGPRRRTTPINCPVVNVSASPSRGPWWASEVCLLADEPSGALDSVNGEAVMRMILAACHGGVAAVVVTHDAKLASWADRVVFLRDGKAVDETLPPPSPEELLNPDVANPA